MSNNNIKSRGFTIVELLIVIVVIAILATISIVAYNGIQNRGKTSAGQALASQVAKKAEAYNTVQSSYPTFAELTAATSAVKEAQLDNTSAVIGTAVDGSSAVGGKVVSYTNAAAATGACVGYWDYAATTPGIKYIKVGSATCP